MHPIFFTKFSTITFSVISFKLLELVGNYIFWNYRFLRSFWCILKVCGMSHGHRVACQKNPFSPVFLWFLRKTWADGNKIGINRCVLSICIHWYAWQPYPMKNEGASGEKRNLSCSTKNCFEHLLKKSWFYCHRLRSSEKVGKNRKKWNFLAGHPVAVWHHSNLQNTSKWP